MSEYLYRIQPVRPDMLITGPTDFEADVVGRHFEYLKALLEDGVVILAGRTMNCDERTFGIVIFNAHSDAAATLIMNADPAVSEGVMQAELFPYHTALIAERNRRN